MVEMDTEILDIVSNSFNFNTNDLDDSNIMMDDDMSTTAKTTKQKQKTKKRITKQTNSQIL
jgi:hypothetical protein